MANLKILVGRSSQCDYTIENAERYGNVSAKHATISETDIPNTYLFEDHSTNGSYVNGQFVHNDSCKITITDHITLGRKFTLPLTDLVKRYFTERRTTKRKPQEVQPQLQSHVFTDVNEVTQSMFPSEVTIGLTSSTTTPTPSVVRETITIEKVPGWFWGLYCVSILIAFAIGFYTYTYFC